MGSILARTPGIYLTGFMGSGKTTMGKLLAEELGWTFIDLDDDIEAAAGTTIAEVFANKGEAGFRRIEHDALKARVHRVMCGDAMVLALGGGAFAQENNRDLLRDAGLSIWLDAALDLIRRRIAGQSHRPLAQDPERFASLFAERRLHYASAHFQVAVDTDDSAETLKRLLELPLWA